MIVIGADHAGYSLKEALKDFIINDLQLEIIDMGTNSTASVDYPEIAQSVAQVVAEGEADAGIIICGTGIGVSIAANKVKGIRAALCHDTYTAIMSKKHNNANLLALGARTTLLENAIPIVENWLKTEFEGGRHETRVKMLE